MFWLHRSTTLSSFSFQQLSDLNSEKLTEKDET